MSDFGKDAWKRVERMKGDRGVWESHWTEVAELVRPDYSRSFVNNSPAFLTAGEKRTEKMFDSTAAIALSRFASAMESMLTPQNSRWHRLTTNDAVLKKDRSVRLWMEDATDALFRYRYSPKANYASQQHEVYMDLGSFGTGALFIDQLAGAPGLRYRTIALNEVYFQVNHQGMVDTVYRPFNMTARQMVQQFPETCPAVICESLKTQPEKEFEVLHCVMPRQDVDPARMDYKGMDFASYYVAKLDGVILAEGGFRTFPYSVSRYITMAGEIYGRSPAMMALPAIKVLNEEKKTVLKQGHRVIDPVLLVHDDGVLDTLRTTPGAVNFGGVSSEGRPLVHSLPTGNLTLAKEMMEAERMTINDIFLVTLFQILVDTPRMTATEVLERSREKGPYCLPLWETAVEALGPQIEREADLLMMQGLLPPMPELLVQAKGEYHIQYDSPLSRAQRAEEAAGTMRTIAYAAEIAAQTQDPSVMDRFNFDVIIPDLAFINAVPERFMATDDEVEAKREGRNQAAQQQQLVDAAPAIASLVTKGGAAPASVIPDLIQQARDWLNFRAQAYRSIFTGPQADVVLRDLAKFCRAKESTFSPDPRMHAVLEGRREVWLRIASQLHMTEEELWKQYGGPSKS